MKSPERNRELFRESLSAQLVDEQLQGLAGRILPLMGEGADQRFMPLSVHMSGRSANHLETHYPGWLATRQRPPPAP